MSARTQADEYCPTKIHEDTKNHFSQGLRVLAIDDNVVCLKVLACNLQKCGYKVSTTTDALEAIEMLRKNKDAYDVVITEVVRSDMDGFRIVEMIEHETGIPVIMTSANNDVEIIEKAVRHGALDYLVKPVRVEILKNIWQHVVRKSMNRSKQIEDVGANANKNNAVMKDDPECDGAQSTCSTGDNENSQADSRKRPRVDWVGHLNDKFLDVVRRLEAQDIKVVPKVILKMMNEPNLTRQQVASHLQKHRLADQERKEPMEGREISRQLSHINGYIPRPIGPNIAPFTGMFAQTQTQPQPHQNFRPIQCSYPNMIPERIWNHRNTSHVSSQMEIQPEALNPPRFGSDDSLPSYCNQRKNVGIQVAHPRASKSNLVANGYQVVGGIVGDIASQRTSILQRNSNTGPVPTYLPGSYEDRKPFVLADPRTGDMGGQIPAPKEESAVKSVGYKPHVSDTHVGQIQAPKEESASTSVGCVPHVSETANICFEYEEIGALVNHCPAPTL